MSRLRNVTYFRSQAWDQVSFPGSDFQLNAFLAIILFCTLHSDFAQEESRSPAVTLPATREWLILHKSAHLFCCLDQSDRIASRITPFVLPRINLEPRTLFIYIELGYWHPATTSSLLPALVELVSILAYSSAKSSRFCYAAKPFFKTLPHKNRMKENKKDKTHRRDRKLILTL